MSKHTQEPRLDWKLSARNSIKKFCRECNGETENGHYYDCLDTFCPLYPFKEGKGNYEFPEDISQEHKDYIKSLGNNLIRKSRTLTEEHKNTLKNSLKNTKLLAN